MKRWLLIAVVFAPFISVQATQNPEAVYNRTCVACHEGQLPTAPRRGDRTAWAPRLAQGMQTLEEHVTQGFRAMPPRGLCKECSSEDYRAVIRWMSE
ncbi:c-type cytochrome [Pseudomonas sp. NPDC090202]|uniref:c-type cytochrome n=1 Tax=unclassified Pseudomonas TaxID=196821 RepID=UPI0037F1C3D4